MRDDELMALRAETLYTVDARGRLLLSNEPRVDSRRPAQRLFLGWTLGGCCLRIRADLPDDLERELRNIVSRLPAPVDLSGRPSLAALRAALERHGPVGSEGGGPAYRFPASLTPSAEVVRLTMENRDLARDTFPWLQREVDDWQPCFAIVRDGVAVSTCFSSRITQCAHEAGLETLPAYRRRGYAVAVTQAWGAAVRALGRVPLYSTGWDNLASQAVAHRAGLLIFGADATME